MKKIFSLAALAAPMLAVVGPAHAELPAAVTTAVTTAQTDMVALYTALTGAGVVIWVGRLIYNRFRVK